jgi:hypothetical protein
MNKTRRASLIILLFVPLLILVVLFRSIIMANVVTPLALVAWVAWRTILSVDQKIYWGMLIFSAFFYVFHRLAVEPAIVDKARPTVSNATLENVRYWRNSILFTSDEIEQPNLLKRSLGEVLARMYATQQNEAASFEIYDAFKRHQILLPENIYNFLFPDELSGSGRSIKKVLKTILDTPRRYIRRWTRRDVVDYYRSIDDVLTFMEAFMEVNYNDGHIHTRSH